MVLRVRTPNRACWRRCGGPRDQLGNGGCLRVARKERQGQNRLPGFILYDHHQGRIVIPALFSQLPDCALGMRKCRRNIRQVRTIRIIPDPVPSAYYKEISRHQTPPRCSISYSNTSSASTSRLCGIVRPSALAVFRLIAYSNKVGCSIGSSPGFAPRRIRAT